MGTRRGDDAGPEKARWKDLIRRHRNSPSFKRRRRILGTALLALVLVGALVVALGFSGEEDAISRGVEVGGVAVGGMSRAEARDALRAEASQSLARIQFGKGEGATTVSGESLGVALDVEESVQDAYAVGREGWFGERAFAALRGSSGGVEIPAAVSFDRAAAEEDISGLAGSVAREPENATFTVNDSGELEVTEGKPGSKLAEQETLGNLEESLASLDGQVPIATNSVAPEKTAEELPDVDSAEKLGEFESDYRYSNSEARRTNLRMASQAVDGTVIAPGEVFSMNDHISGLDYKEALVFSEGGEATANGGGLCQVTSTLYMAAQYAGMEIVERHPHYAVLPYIRPGFDATVWFGYNGTEELDMKFKNTTGSPIYIREYVDDKGIMHAEVWGQPTGKKVEMRSEQVFRDLDRGIKWKTYKKVTKDGEVLREGPLYTDLYSFPPSSGDPEKYNEVRVGSWSAG